MSTSLYVHVPFCVVKCGYCDFNSYEVADEQVHDRFLDALDRELEMRWKHKRPISIFVGGGTPTYLSASRFARLWEVLSAHVEIAPSIEVTVECNPESLSAEKARVARSFGANRASVGAQSFDERFLRQLDRPHDAESVRRAVSVLRDAGFDNISIDMIHSLPGQTIDEWMHDIDRAIELQPDHISCYALTIEKGTRFYRDWEKGVLEAADEDVDREMFTRTRERLAEAGYEPYEISNFAGRGGPCRHNDHYWQQGEYTGVGPGASSHRDGWRTTNLKPVDSWAASLERGLPPTGEAELLTIGRRLGEAMWLGLRRRDGVDMRAVSDRLGIDAVAMLEDRIARSCENGWAEWRGSRLRLTTKGILVADAIGSSFLH
ncbi:MAG: radical SAM family heme chaperone HemW [Planctomycetota bacterium]